MDVMKTALLIARILIYLVGVFFIVMALDVFDLDNTVFENIIGFIISSTPGIILILLNTFLRKRYFIYGFVLVAVSIFFFFFFRMHEDILGSWPTILTVAIPPFVAGILHLVYYQKVKNENIKS
jgi:hypothetical protein